MWLDLTLCSGYDDDVITLLQPVFWTVFLQLVLSLARWVASWRLIFLAVQSSLILSTNSCLVYLWDGNHVCIHEGVYEGICHFPFELHRRSMSICDSVQLWQYIFLDGYLLQYVMVSSTFPPCNSTNPHHWHHKDFQLLLFFFLLCIGWWTAPRFDRVELSLSC